MRVSLSSPAAFMLSGLLLATAAVPAAAGEAVLLSEAELDTITAGATAGLQFNGFAAGSGSLFSTSQVFGEASGAGDQRAISAGGFIVAFGVGGSGVPGGASSDAGTNGQAIGDYTYLRTINVRSDTRFGSFTASATGGAAVGIEW